MFTAAFAPLFALHLAVTTAGDEVDFEGEVLPLLEQRCHRCHGPEQQEAGLRLDRRSAMLSGGDSGPALVPADASHSLLLARVSAADRDTRMPPSGRALTAAQVDTLRRWIDEGAAFPAALEAEIHWAFLRPERAALPEAIDGAAHPIDRFVRSSLLEQGLTPTPEADRWTLARRVSLDLIGLPPSPEEAEAFVNDPDPEAYERMVDRLLASPRYGERWARPWLDLARYGDTHGYEKDRPRSMWPWRDWVIDAINEDLPFDQFTRQQLAGDLLPGAGLDEHIATGFHRNTMVNEEGGADVEEFRYFSVVDRTDTTGAVWLGLTLGCARCHSHKFDPIRQREYWQLLSFLNQDDEIEVEVPDPQIDARRDSLLQRIAALEEALPTRFPVDRPVEWTTLRPVELRADSSARLVAAEDGVVEASGPSPARATYTLEFDVELDGADRLRIETLVRDGQGPGRTAHGNFVLSELRLAVRPSQSAVDFTPLSLAHATADGEQPEFPIASAIDGDAGTGWAVDDGARPLRPRTAAVAIEGFPGGPARLRVELEQAFGSQHTLARFRLSLGRAQAAVGIESTREQLLEQSFEQWQRAARDKAVAWSAVEDARLHAEEGASLRKLEDGSILVFGDKPNRDTYAVEFEPAAPVRAIRLDAMPDPSLPLGGPGRAPLFMTGDFLLSEIEFAVSDSNGDWVVHPFAEARHGHAAGGRAASLAIDGKLDTGWASGRTGQASSALFVLADAIPPAPDRRVRVRLIHHYIHQTTLGRFRLFTSDHGGPYSDPILPAQVEGALLALDACGEREREAVRRAFLAHTPELAAARAKIEALRRRLPARPTTLVLADRGDRQRRTHLHHRGEYLQPGEAVEAAVPSVLHPLAADAPRNRRGLADWLVDPANPLVGRVAVNRAWQAFFGVGLVPTAEDFGTRGERPSHPRLLDWLAVEFIETGWSRKGLHRSIVTSRTYRQSARADAGSRRLDPENRWLSRGPRFRLDAEQVRDQALASAGLLTSRIGGPSVFPPQPGGITGLSYGAMAWNTSTGPDRWRRGLYTYTKRTAPYATASLFDAPSGEVSCTRRARTNTPLQALVLLNDTVFVEAAQGLARRVMREREGDEDRLRHAFRCALVRPPEGEELETLRAFLDRQRARLRAGELDAPAIAGALDPAGTPLGELAAGADEQDPVELAAWTAVARALLNLDEAVTKE